jgi:hypothetical protein
LLGMPVTVPQVLGGILLTSGVLLSGLRRRSAQPVTA